MIHPPSLSLIMTKKNWHNIFLDPKSFFLKIYFNLNFLWAQNYFGPQILLRFNFMDPKFLFYQRFVIYFRGAKSAATWQPSCQKVSDESGSDRKFLDLSPALSCNRTIWQQSKINDIDTFTKWTFFGSIVLKYPKKSNRT